MKPAVLRAELSPGAHVAGWVVVNTMARGGFAAVYEVRHGKTGELGALKLMHAHLMTSAQTLARFEREIQIIRALRHRNIVQLLDAGFHTDGRPYLCMELLVAEELHQVIQLESRLEISRALTIIEQVCDAVGHAHAHGVIHRDIKSRNVMVCLDGRVVLLDFGIAKLTDALAAELTATNQALGTPACMAPEQVHGDPPDARTDVYALAGLLFHMLTGRQPFHDPSPTMMQYLHMNAKRPRASALVKGLPEQLDDVIVRAMAIDRANRYPDVASFLAAALAAGRGSRVIDAPAVMDAVALMVKVVDRTGGEAYDASLLEDLERVMPAAERFLGERGFSLAVDLGSSAIFVANAETVPNPARMAMLAFEQLAARPGRDPRVEVGICVNRDVLTFAGGEMQPCALLRPSAWGVPEGGEGVWATAAVQPPSGRRLR